MYPPRGQRCGLFSRLMWGSGKTMEDIRWVEPFPGSALLSIQSDVGSPCRAVLGGNEMCMNLPRTKGIVDGKALSVLWLGIPLATGSVRDRLRPPQEMLSQYPNCCESLWLRVPRAPQRSLCCAQFLTPWGDTQLNTAQEWGTQAEGGSGLSWLHWF